MRVNKVTITGADDATSLSDIDRLTKEYPFVEWGILFSKSKEGSPRYPARTKILEFASLGVPLSAHFCGWHSRSVMENQNFRLIDELPASFKRVQINYNFHYGNNWQVKWIIDYAADHPERAIIFQVNEANGAAIELIRANLRSENIHFLYDSSGGRGTVIQNILPPFRTYTGYSGGLGPANIEEFLCKLYTNRLSNEVWVDMESAVRIENHLSPASVEEVLSINKKFRDYPIQPLIVK